jgi:hypothetical protein
MSYDPNMRNGWARGLVHFHTRFSDGFASVMRAGEIAVRAGFDFLIITDHIRNLKLFTHKSLQEYIEACDAAAHKLGIPIIPGGEIEIHWNNATTSDFSEAHTLVLSIRSLVAAGEFDWVTPETDPFAHWPDTAGGKGTILAAQEMLRRHNLPSLASHQFQHSLVSTKWGERSDYRYDLERLATSRYFDFFYSGAIELIHEMEDIELVQRYMVGGPEDLKGVYSSCDFHVGPETTWPPIADLVDRVRPLRAVYRWIFREVAALLLKLKGEPEAAPFPWFAEEQLSHATYVYLGNQPCTETTILDALRDGRTCVTRGRAEFADLDPAPSLTQVRAGPAGLSLDLPVSYSDPRPRSVIVLRDGQVAHWEPYAIAAPSILFKWTDQTAPPGVHTYQIYVPSKFLCSPIRFAV